MKHNFERSLLLNKMILIKPFLIRVLYDHFKLMYVYLNEGDDSGPFTCWFFHNIFYETCIT